MDVTLVVDCDIMNELLESALDNEVCTRTPQLSYIRLVGLVLPTRGQHEG